MAKSLDGICVLVTRPAHQAEKLCNLIESMGGKARRFPVIEIAPSRDLNRLTEIVQRLAEFDIVIFISPNAADLGIQAIMKHGGLPKNVKVAAVGKGTARRLNALGVEVDIFPTEQFNSEALLATEELQTVSEKRIVIFRGEGGRELLADSLRERGARVEYAECYRRIKPRVKANELLGSLSQGELDIITVTSNEGLQNLVDMVGEQSQPELFKLPLVVVSERARDLAQDLGFMIPAIVADNASDEMLVQAIEGWQESH